MYALKCVRAQREVVFVIGKIYPINRIDTNNCSNKLMDATFNIDIANHRTWFNDVDVVLQSSMYEFEIVEV